MLIENTLGVLEPSFAIMKKEGLNLPNKYF